MYKQGEERWANWQQWWNQPKLMSHDGESIWVSLAESNPLASLGDSVDGHLKPCGRHRCCLANNSAIVHDVVRYEHCNLRVCWAGTCA